MSKLCGHVALENGHLCVFTRLYNLIGKPGKCLMGVYKGAYVGAESDYIDVTGGKLLGAPVETFGPGTHGLRWFRVGDYADYALVTEDQPLRTFEHDVPKPKSKFEIQWCPTSASYASPGWYKLTKKGWVPC